MWRIHAIIVYRFLPDTPPIDEANSYLKQAVVELQVVGNHSCPTNFSYPNGVSVNLESYTNELSDLIDTCDFFNVTNKCYQNVYILKTPSKIMPERGSNVNLKVGVHAEYLNMPNSPHWNALVEGFECTGLLLSHEIFHTYCSESTISDNLLNSPYGTKLNYQQWQSSH
jgi:hypothetical protein